ncbi:DUF4192 domain-containing protein [Nocardia sp. NPDC057227]|uniref:DUF4192 domain-containing protein n=1 Tax=Nocardia sp. NPDC057227 TaxID=3346056 RepID=UPI00362698CE
MNTTDQPRWNDRQTAYLADPGALLASVPAMIGFTPERSLVIAVLREPTTSTSPPATNGVARVDAVVRFELNTPDGHPVPADLVAECITGIDGPGRITQIIAVVVDDHTDPVSGRNRWRPLVTALAGHFETAGTVLGAAYLLPGLAAGTPWTDLLDPDRAGALADPADSPVAFGHVLAGVPLRGSRDELTALIALDPELEAAVEHELTRASGETHQRYIDAALHGTAIDAARGEAEFVLALIDTMRSGSEPSPDQLARVAVALRDRAVRDVMFALPAAIRAHTAERLWTLLTRATTGAERADAATLLGFTAYLRGDGPFAGIAFDAAIDALPGHPMAVLLETALRSGTRPTQLRRLIRTGHESATDLGLDLDDQEHPATGPGPADPH